MTKITPTVGRIVHYWPSAYDRAGRNPMSCNNIDPLAAIVTFVHGDNMVNLSVFDSNGKQFGIASISLKQPGMPYPTQGGYCEWMACQISQNNE